MNTNKLNEFKSLLENLTQEITSCWEKKITKENSTNISTMGDEIDVATEFQNLQLDNLMSDRDSFKLKQIQAALEKIEAGEYGKCEDCGEDISEKRLKAIPYANYCLECKEYNEKNR